MPLKHALITGGSRGIGLSIAQLLARNNYACTLISRSSSMSSLHAALSSLSIPSSSSTQTENPHAVLRGDIASQNFWTQDTFKAMKERTKRFDVVVNCAGITQAKLFARMDESEIREIVDTNLTAMMIGTRFLLRNRWLQSSSPSSRRDKQKGQEDESADKGGEEGRTHTPVIVNIASLMGVSGGFGAVAYAASKAGVLGFTRALATEMGGNGGVRVNAVVPGYVETDMTRSSEDFLLFVVICKAYDKLRCKEGTAPRLTTRTPFEFSTDLNRSELLRRIPLGRFAKPEEIASAALFLAQNEYAHNCIINLDGGISAL
ncbi:NAD(P)-binding protein [Periconia macrospinosa]|uniref:NAD(P)-binding protein n=1 Tax=Periconia macrospinosa TaxID=97972 RepID=A0A2V1E344_9PLEO|nr:NAD(P)-binding protein [Periconia macrospinosa]